VASRTYFLANPGQMSYVASKGAVLGMTRVLAKEMGDEGITVNAVMPGLKQKYGNWNFFDYFARPNILDMAKELRGDKLIPKPAEQQ